MVRYTQPAVCRETPYWTPRVLVGWVLRARATIFFGHGEIGEVVSGCIDRARGKARGYRGVAEGRVTRCNVQSRHGRHVQLVL